VRHRPRRRIDASAGLCACCAPARPRKKRRKPAIGSGTGEGRWPPAVVSPLGTPLPRRPPLKGSPKGGNPSPHAALALRAGGTGPQGGCARGKGPAPALRPPCAGSNSKVRPALYWARLPPLGAPRGAVRRQGRLRAAPVRAACAMRPPRFRRQHQRKQARASSPTASNPASPARQPWAQPHSSPFLPSWHGVRFCL
jgi:hypothetical protein